MNRPALGVFRNRRALVHRLTDDIENAPERGLADRNGDRLARIHDLHAAHDAVGGAHGDGADLVAADVLLDFRDQLSGIDLHRDRVVELGELLGLELDVEHWSNDLDDLSHVLLLFTGLLCHLISAIL